MTDWYSKNLGDGLTSSEALKDIEEYFQSQYASAEKPKDMAVFIRHESEGRLHCEVMIYFSPASAAVAKVFNADPCVKPSPEGLSLLLGAEDSWLIMFPEQKI